MFVAPAEPGMYTFRCHFHANTHGTLIVAS